MTNSNPYLDDFTQMYEPALKALRSPWRNYELGVDDRYTLTPEDAYKLRTTNTFHLRDLLVRKYSWAVPNEKALECIRTLATRPIIEWGAGSGYWASLLAQRGVEITCYDKKPWDTLYHPVTECSDPTKVDWRGKALMLVWPPYEEPMASEVLREYLRANARRTIIYVGEGYGGCTGDDIFHEQLKITFGGPDEVITLPTYEGIHDSLVIYKS